MIKTKDYPLISKLILQFLKDIEDGTITLSAEYSPDSVYCGNMKYNASNGWTIVVFNDCCEWDYIDRLVIPEMDVTIVYDEIYKHMPLVDEYSPPDNICLDVYGI